VVWCEMGYLIGRVAMDLYGAIIHTRTFSGCLYLDHCYEPIDFTIKELFCCMWAFEPALNSITCVPSREL